MEREETRIRDQTVKKKRDTGDRGPGSRCRLCGLLLDSVSDIIVAKES